MSTKVVYILSSGHSGSTILGSVIGELPGFFHAGELRLIWRTGLLGETRCGCGAPVAECEVWSPVVASVFERVGAADAREVLRWQHEALHGRPMWDLLHMDPASARRDRALTRYLEVVRALYEEIARTTGAAVVVDSTKRQDNAALLRLLPDLDALIVHLVRDPRAVVFSWDRRLDGRSRGRLPRPTARGWVTRNRDADALRLIEPDRAILIRYEDFVAQPRPSIEAIARAAGEPSGPLPLVGEHTVRLHPNHTAAGNKGRFKTGEVHLEHDDAWTAKQPRLERWLTTALALPRLRRYGYDLRPRPRTVSGVAP
jgi:hypothetical protein